MLSFFPRGVLDGILICFHSTGKKGGILKDVFGGLKYLLSTLTYHNSSHLFLVENITRQAD